MSNLTKLYQKDKSIFNKPVQKKTKTVLTPKSIGKTRAVMVPKKAMIENRVIVDLTKHDLDDLPEVSLEDLNDDQNVFADPSIRKKKENKQLARSVLEELAKLKVDQPQLKPSIKMTKNGASIVLLFTDWHIGKVINSRTGKRVFDTKIARDRVKNTLLPLVTDYIEKTKSSFIVDEIVVLFGGDIIENDIIFDTQRFRIDGGVAVQFRNACEIIFDFLSELRSITNLLGIPVPIRVECVGGNHGRASSLSETGESSWDIAIYSALDLIIKSSNLEGVSLEYAIEDFKEVNIRNHIGILTHSAPPQSETASAKSKFGGWYENFKYDFFCYGHRHHWGLSTFNGRPLFMNGCLCGPDDYSDKLAVKDEWSQLAWTITDNDVMNNLIRLKEKK
jgi:hypothetical protein